MENQNEVPKKSTHGGRRPGAGRPNVKKAVKSIALRIPEDVVAILDRHENRSAFIIDAIRAYASSQTEKPE